MPVVVLDRPVPGASAPTVMPDNVGGARAATQHLLRHGYWEVWWIAGPEAILTAEERLEGWREAIQAPHSRSTVPSLATMRQPFERYGELALGLIHEHTAGMHEITRLSVAPQSRGTCRCKTIPRKVFE